MKGGGGGLEGSWEERETEGEGRRERENGFAEGNAKLVSKSAVSVVAVSICVNLDEKWYPNLICIPVIFSKVKYILYVCSFILAIY